MERYRTIYNSYYHSAHGVVCVFDIVKFILVKTFFNKFYSNFRLMKGHSRIWRIIGSTKSGSMPHKMPSSFWSETRRTWTPRGKSTSTGQNGQWILSKSMDIKIARLAKRIGVSLFEVSAKTGINCDEAFVELATVMRDRLLATGNMVMVYSFILYFITQSALNSDSDDSDHLSSAFHVDGVISEEKVGGRLLNAAPNCCSAAGPRPTFV